MVLIAIGCLSFGLANLVWAAKEYYDAQYLSVPGSPGTLTALNYSDNSLYVAISENFADKTGFSGKLIRYELATGRPETLWCNNIYRIHSLAVSGERALLSASLFIPDNHSGAQRQTCIMLLELLTGQIIDVLFLNDECYACYGYAVAILDDERFAVSIPGKNEVVFLAVNVEGNLIKTGAAKGIREAKGLLWHNGTLYVGGSTRVNHETRGAFYTVDVNNYESTLLFTAMESRGGFNGLGIEGDLLIASNFHNLKLLQNSLFVYDLNKHQLITEIKDLPIPTTFICFGGRWAYAAALAGNKVLEIRLDYKALRKKAGVKK